MYTTKNIAQKTWDMSFFIFHVLVQHFFGYLNMKIAWMIHLLSYEKVFTHCFFFKNIELNLKSKSKFSFLKIILANVFFYKKWFGYKVLNRVIKSIMRVNEFLEFYMTHLEVRSLNLTLAWIYPPIAIIFLVIKILNIKIKSIFLII
jgi:hypothetical protein